MANFTAEHIPLLRAARARIESGADEFICHALNNVTDNSVRHMTDVIEGLLGTRRCSYTAWLCDQDPDKYEPMSYFEFQVQAKAGRLLWLDMMIDAAEKGAPVPPPPIPPSLEQP